MATRYGKSVGKKVAKVMREEKAGTLKSGSGAKVTNPKQAIAIALSEARKEGKKVPPKKKAASKKSATKKTASKKTASKKTASKKSASKKTTARKKSAAK